MGASSDRPWLTSWVGAVVVGRGSGLGSGTWGWARGSGLGSGTWSGVGARGWQVLTLIQQGVYHELEKDIRDDVKALTYVMQMDDVGVRRQLTRITIEHLPAMDVRGFRKVR